MGAVEGLLASHRHSEARSLELIERLEACRGERDLLEAAKASLGAAAEAERQRLLGEVERLELAGSSAEVALRRAVDQVRPAAQGGCP